MCWFGEELGKVGLNNAPNHCRMLRGLRGQAFGTPAQGQAPVGDEGRWIGFGALRFWLL